MFGNFTRTILVAAAATGLASASIIGVTDSATLGPNDFIDWGQLGNNGTTFSSPADVTSNNGLTATTETDDPAGFIRLDEGAGWAGNFTDGDKLLNNNSASTFPLTIVFDSPIFGAGAQIAMDSGGPFTAQIQAFNGVTLLDTVTEDGNSTDPSPIFLGILDTDAEITSIQFTLTAPDNSSDFAINTLQLNDAATPADAPEPGTLLLSAAGVAAAGMLARRKRCKA